MMCRASDVFWFLALAAIVVTSACGDDQDGDESESDGGVGVVHASDGSVQDNTSPCPEHSLEYYTTSGRRVCCPQDTILCDELGEWYEGGCWKPATDCDTIIWCDARWQACIPGYYSSCEGDTMACLASCPEGTLEYVTTGGRRLCCPEATHLFCDENEAGYPGGCFKLGIDCGTITYCDGDWRACYEGASPRCSAGDTFSCVIE